MMNPPRLSIHALALATAIAAPSASIQAQQDGAPAPEADFVELFDGRSLSGWTGQAELWRVEAGVLVGSTHGHKIPRNSFLIWKGGEVANFDLRVQIRVLGKNNSGVQYRSRVVDASKHSVQGYQADLHSKPAYHGMLYEEGGRGIVAQNGQTIRLTAAGKREVGGAPTTESPADISKWHELRVLARGRTLEHFVDGRRTVRIVDDSNRRSMSGVIAIQLHRGAPMRVELRSVRLRQLPATKDDAPTRVTGKKRAKPARKAGTKPSWIWLGDPRDGDVVAFERSFKLGRAQRCRLVVSCDNKATVRLDGKLVGRHGRWEEPRSFDLGRIKRGEHTLTIEGQNEGGPAGLVAELRIGGGRKIRTDASWRAKRPDDKEWQTAKLLAPLGRGPWVGAVTAALDGVPKKPFTMKSRAAKELEVHKGFRGDLLLAPPKHFGSWVSLTAIPGAELGFYASDQRSGLYRIDVRPAADGSMRTTATRQPVDLGGAQGLCLIDGVLYASVNGRESGLWRVTDSDGDGAFDAKELLLKFLGAGEHGPHAVLRAPDGEGLYVVCGNHTALPQRSFRRSARPVGAVAEDHIPAVIVDPNGHANKIRAPGGYVIRVDFDGKNPRLQSSGYRNAFDIAIDANGEIFAYDSDMEWDFGLPWYRPTRIVHAVNGADFGWRTGSSKWRTHFEDSLPPLHEIGPGSPTGLLFGEAPHSYTAKFPAAWRRKLFALDWTFGTLWAFELEAQGASFRATKTPFVTGKPLPLTDACIGSDGAMYFTTGGRGTATRLFRISAEEPADVAEASAARAPTPEAALRRKLESYHGMQSGERAEEAIAAALPHLDHPDRHVRHAARLALESTPAVADMDQLPKLDAKKRPLAAAVLLLVRARFLESRQARNGFFEKLAAFPIASAPKDALLCGLRACEIAIANFGRPKPSVARAVIAKLDPIFPRKDGRVDAELARILCALNAPTAVAKCLSLMDARGQDPEQDWAGILVRNDRYGKPIRRMLDNPPPTLALHYVDCMRQARKGWNIARYERVLTFLRRSRAYAAGNSYRGFIDRLRDAVVEKMSDEDKRRVASILGSWKSSGAAEAFTAPRGPGKAWSVDAALAAIDVDKLAERSYASGRNLFHAVGCASCHRYDGEGGGIGPDLSTVASKYSLKEILESTIEPQMVIADQFVGKRIELKDGTIVLGQVATNSKAGAGKLEIWPANAVSEAKVIDRNAVRSIQSSKESPMPSKLLDRLSADELQDLLAFLLAASEQRSASGKK